MKRSDAIKKLIPKVICPHVIITREDYENGIYYERAKSLLDFIENDLDMWPPDIGPDGFHWGECEVLNEWESE